MVYRKILIVHPNDNSTAFLNRIKNHLKAKFESQTHHFNVYPNQKSHIDCINRITSHSENGFVLFLGHGRSDKLFGGKGKYYENVFFVSQSAIDENPDDYYYNDDFINKENSYIFSNKKIFCLACNSNDKLAKFALDSGVKTFVGFGGIPTSKLEFEEDGLKNVSHDIVKLMKTEINYIIKKSLEIGITNNYSFIQLQNTINFITSQKITYYLVERKKLKDRHLLADYLYYFKSNMQIVGDKYAKLVD